MLFSYCQTINASKTNWGSYGSLRDRHYSAARLKTCSVFE